MLKRPKTPTFYRISLIVVGHMLLMPHAAMAQEQVPPFMIASLPSTPEAITRDYNAAIFTNATPAPSVQAHQAPDKEHWSTGGLIACLIPGVGVGVGVGGLHTVHRKVKQARSKAAPACRAATHSPAIRDL